MSERIQCLSEIKIDERYTFDDGDEERMGNICEYEFIGSTYSKRGNDFVILLKHKNNKHPSIISCDEHSLTAYFYEDGRDFFDNNLRDFYENGSGYQEYLQETFGYEIA